MTTNLENGRRDRMVVAITGASGAIYGIRLLERLREVHVETHLILSRWAKVTIEQETGYAASRVKRLADVNYSEGEQAAAISSGSYLTLGMVIAPCSTKTLAAIATGFAHNLICRAADVSLKERRRLVLVVREAPLSTIHLRNMVTVSELGATVFPPSPSFYDRPKGIDELVEYTVIRILDQFGINLQLDRRWEGIASSRTIAAEGEDDE